jgi:hypothetical protein
MVFVPEVMRTCAIEPPVSVTPRNVSPWLPATSASRVKTSVLLSSKNSTFVLPATSTSVKINPKAVVVAGVGRTGNEEADVGHVAVHRRKELLRAESLEVVRKAEQDRRSAAAIGAYEEARPRRAEDDSARRVDVEKVRE